MSDARPPFHGSSLESWVNQRLTEFQGVHYSNEVHDLLCKVASTANNTPGMESRVCELLNSMSYATYQYINKGGYPQVFFQDPTRYGSDRSIDLHQYLVGSWVSPRSLQELKNMNHGIHKRDIVTLACPMTSDMFEEHLESLFKARPEICGLYAFLFSSVGCKVAWIDPSGIDVSPLCAWDQDSLPLIQGYLESLYFPSPDHHPIDHSVQPSRSFSPGKASWTIDCGNVRYEDCEMIFQGGAWDKRTTVFESQGDDFVVIKDYWHDDYDEGVDEARFLRAIHHDGVVPGVVTLVDAGVVNVRTGDRDGSQTVQAITTAPSTDAEDYDRESRTKHRLIMGSKGVSLCMARSVRDILMGAYDFLQIHRWLLKKKEILYRDTSKTNLLIYPVHRVGVRDVAVVQDPPLFIGRILGLETGDVTVSSSRCLLIDFDNSCHLLDEETGKPHNDLRYTAGTDPYVARAVFRHAYLPREEKASSAFAQMPQLSDQAQQIYTNAYGEHQYEKYTDDDETYHGSLPLEVESGTFYHRPDHDVESLYWLLVDVLVRVEPRGGFFDNSSYQMFATHWGPVVNSRGQGDAKKHFLDYSIKYFEHMLHPCLRPLAKMLENMTAQIVPEYGYLEPRPAEDHLHEAFGRIILQQLVDMGECDIPLDPGRLRLMNDEELYCDSGVI